MVSVLLGGALEIAGILCGVVLGLKVVKYPDLNAGRLWYPERRQVVLTVALLLAGVVVSLAGNIASIYV